MPCYRMILAYDGTAYAGWQFQPGLPTIQGTLEEALQRIVGTRVRVVGSGRTDAGVHALAQVASFRCDTRLSVDVLRRAINANTPEDIHVSDVCVAPDAFHAIRDAVVKRYRYVIQDGPHRDVFSRSTAWHVTYVLDVPRMQAGARHLVGRHDFRSFETAGAPRRTSIRTIHEIRLERFARHALQPLAIEVEADGFLYNMVRNIVGSLVVVGRGDQSPDWISQVLAAQDRGQAGSTAPARGLMLLNVRYAR
jgi:tRNA pseudouridine38-40 synthase